MKEKERLTNPIKIPTKDSTTDDSSIEMANRLARLEVLMGHQVNYANTMPDHMQRMGTPPTSRPLVPFKSCFFCGEDGHFIANCPTRIEERRTQTRPPQPAPRIRWESSNQRRGVRFDDGQQPGTPQSARRQDRPPTAWQSYQRPPIIRNPPTNYDFAPPGGSGRGYTRD
jgi:hypothetical protein